MNPVEKSPKMKNNALNNLCSIFIGMEIGVIRNSAELKLATIGTPRKGRSIPLHHHIFVNNTWVAGPPASQPTCWTTTTPSHKDHADFGQPVDDPRSLHQTQVSTVTDTGCQSTAIYPAFAYRAGFRRKNFIPVVSRMTSPNKTDLGMKGAVVMEFSCKDDYGNMYTTNHLCYKFENISSMYLSRQACKDLHLIDQDFPQPRPRTGDNHTVGSTELAQQNCDCPARPKDPPPLPTDIPSGIDVTEDQEMLPWVSLRRSPTTPQSPG